MTSLAEVLPWHKPYWDLLQQYLLHNRVPQALLVSGNPGLGKQRLALHFAKALLCEQRSADGYACDQCHSCLLQQADTHPDFIRLQPEETSDVQGARKPGATDAQGVVSVAGDKKLSATKTIGIDKIRQLLPVLALKPQFEGFRVVMIVSAEWLNTAAANAFLKCLEEPNERTVIILVSAHAGRLPATILSRCQQLKMTPPPATQALAWLKAQQAQGDHALLLTLAQGAPLLALQYAEDNSIALRQSCFDDWMGIAQAQRSPLSVAERWQKLPVIPLLNWLSSWVVDLIKSHYAVQTAHWHNPDLQHRLQEAQKRLDLTALFSLYDVLLTTRKQIHTPLNRQLLFEVILIHWFNLNCRE